MDRDGKETDIRTNCPVYCAVRLYFCYAVEQRGSKGGNYVWDDRETD